MSRADDDTRRPHTDPDDAGGPDTGRWYEFEQVEELRRPFYVRAATLAQARAMVRARPSGAGIGVPDWAPDNPSRLQIVGPGKLADQETAQDMADERGV